MSLLKLLYCFQSADKDLKCPTVAQRPCVIWPLPTSAARSALSSLMAPPSSCKLLKYKPKLPSPRTLAPADAPADAPAGKPLPGAEFSSSGL